MNPHVSAWRLCGLQATIEGLRAQLEAARHAPLRSAADIACGGIRFGDAAHSGAAQAAGRAAAALAEALPGLQAILQEELSDGAPRDSCSDGSPSEVAGRGVQAGGGRAGSVGHQAGGTAVARSADSLRQLKQILDRAAMFHEVRAASAAIVQLQPLPGRNSRVELTALLGPWVRAGGLVAWNAAEWTMQQLKMQRLMCGQC